MRGAVLADPSSSDISSELVALYYICSITDVGQVSESESAPHGRGVGTVETLRKFNPEY